MVIGYRQTYLLIPSVRNFKANQTLVKILVRDGDRSINSVKWAEVEARLLGVCFYINHESCKYFTHSKEAFPKIENTLKWNILSVYQNLTDPYRRKNYFKWLEYGILAENPRKTIFLGEKELQSQWCYC